jgi:polyhydroxyalkanoate synthesis regulator phasin
MSFTHETLISALRDVIREEVRTLAAEIVRDESSDFVIELTRQIEMLIESNGTISEMKEQVDFMSDHEDRIESLEKNSFDELQDEVNDLQRALDKIGDRLDSLEVDDADGIRDMKDNITILDEKVGNILHALRSVNEATSGIY